MSTKRSRKRLHFTIEPLESRVMLAAHVLPTEVGEWHQFRGDQQLTGRAEVPGNIVTPEVVWSEFIGSRSTWVSLKGDEGQSSIELPDVDREKDPALHNNWAIDAPSFALDGTDGLTSIPQTRDHKIGDFLPDSPGLERIEFDSEFTNPSPRGRLLRRENGEWTSVWETEPIDKLLSSNVIIGDFDGDQVDDVAILSWYDLHLYDLRTGVHKATARYSPDDVASGRGYGWFGARDLDQDGKDEFIILGDFQNFIAVIGWDGSEQLTKLWDRTIESAVINKVTEHRPPAHPVLDVDGDKQLEIVTSIFNESGDGQWHTITFDGLTGQIEYDIEDAFLTDTLDVNLDGYAELFLTRTVGPRIPESTGQIEIHQHAQTGWQTIWSASSAGFETSNLNRLDLKTNSNSTVATSSLVAGPMVQGGRPVFFSRRVDATATTTISAWQFDESSGAFGIVGAISGNDTKIIAVRPDTASQLLVQGGSNGGALSEISITGFALHQVEYSTVIGPPRASPVVGRLEGDSQKPTVVVQAANEHIVSFTPNEDGSRNATWRRKGRGTQAGTGELYALTGQHEFGSVSLADLANDGTLMTLLSTAGPQDQAQLVALRPDGSEFWTASFDDFPGATPVWNRGGLTFWSTGNFRRPDQVDVLVNLRRGTLHSDELFLLDGKTGKVIWNRTWGVSPDVGRFDREMNRGAGGSTMAIYDWDGDGLDEAINFFPDVFYVVDGDGTNAIERIFSFTTFPGQPPYYGFPVIDDFLGNGTDSMLFAGNRQVLGLLYPWAEPVWSTGFNDANPAFIQGVADMDGDGDLDVVSVGSVSESGGSQLQVFDAKTGDIQWSLPLPGSPSAKRISADSPTSPAMADIDGDGRFEAIFAIGPTLYAIGTDESGLSGAIKWTMTFPGNLSAPIVADTDGNGQIQIVVTSTDGNIYAVGSSQTSRAHDADLRRRGNKLIITGTTGDDQVSIRTGNDPHLILNGARYNLVSETSSLLFVGNGGADRATIFASDSVREVEVHADKTTLFSPDLIVRVADVSSVNITANGTANVRLYDTTGDEELVLDESASMRGQGFEHTVTGAKKIYAFASKGSDVVRIAGTPKDDKLIGTKDFVYLSNEDVYRYANGFDLIDVEANEGNDKAYFYDSSQDEIFRATSTEASMQGDDYQNVARGFDLVNAYSTQGYDRAVLFQDNEQQILNRSDNSASVSGNGFYNYAGQFDAVKIHSPAKRENADSIGVHRRTASSSMLLDSNRNGTWDSFDRSFRFGAATDVAVAGDWNGDGFDEVAVFRPTTATFYLDLDNNGRWDGQSIDKQYRFGAPGDVPIVGDWNGDGKSEIGVYRSRASTFYLDMNGNGVWDGPTVDTKLVFGSADDLPIAGDWNGDGVDEIGVYRPQSSTFYRDINGSGAWESAIDELSNFGQSGDIPLIGDWNGDQVDQIGVYRAGVLYRDWNDDAKWDSADDVVRFGGLFDLPIAGRWLHPNNLVISKLKMYLSQPLIGVGFGSAQPTSAVISQFVDRPVKHDVRFESVSKAEIEPRQFPQHFSRIEVINSSTPQTIMFAPRFLLQTLVEQIELNRPFHVWPTKPKVTLFQT